MFRFFFIFTLVFFISFKSVAQTRISSGEPGPDRVFYRVVTRGETLNIERIAYFTERIGLTSEEAQLFWPIYNEMDNKRNALFDERAAIMQRFTTDGASMNERQIDEQLRQLVSVQQQEMALPVEYDAKFRKVLPAQKVMNLYIAEMGFRNYLLQRMQMINREPVGPGR